MSSLSAQIKRSFPRPSSPQLGQMAWGSLISSLGTTFQVFAFTYVVYATTKSALATVMVGICFAVAFGVFALPAGKMARSLDHRHVVVAVSLAKALIYAAILALQITGRLSVTAILISSAASGITSSIQYPCWQELLQQFSEKGRLDETNALFSSLSSVSSVAGALVGGVLLDAVGAAPLFAFNVLSYLPLVVIVARLPASQSKTENKKKGASAPLKKVAATIRSSKAVRLAITFTALLELLAWPLLSLLPKVAAEVGPSARIYGLLLASFYVGAALVAILLRRWKTHHPYSRIIRVSTTTSGLALVIAGAVGLAPLGTALTLAGLAFLLAAVGLGLATAQSVLGAITQLGVPKKIEGEVLGIFALITIIFGTVGAFVEGFLADTLEVWWLPLASGAVVFAAMNFVRWRHGFLLLNAADPKSDPDRTHLMSHAESGGDGNPTPPIVHLRKPLTAGTDASSRRDGDTLSA